MVDPADIYAALEGIQSPRIDGIFDSKRPDGYCLTGTILVYSQISNVPGVPIDGEILGTSERWQISIYSTDLKFARDARQAVVDAFHGYESGSILRADWAGLVGPEIYESQSGEHHIPLDFFVES